MGDIFLKREGNWRFLQNFYSTVRMRLNDDYTSIYQEVSAIV